MVGRPKVTAASLDQVAGFDSYQYELSRQSGAPIADPIPGGLMLYTSGTTGQPKGVWRPSGSVPGSATANVAGYVSGDAHLLTGPLYHAAPIVFSLSMPITFGATVIMTNKFNAEETLRSIQRHRVSHSHTVPTMFHRLLALPAEVRNSYDTSSLRYIIHGAAPGGDGLRGQHRPRTVVSSVAPRRRVGVVHRLPGGKHRHAGTGPRQLSRPIRRADR
ncbi:MAG: hypothetical protein EKK51_30405 [Mycolicibacterium sp.]|nr:MULTISPECIES: AMP-binding protein [Mycolicibacterium]RUP26341.1 MAG: hypothetical protein EKK51_30405 [Mycolicibacterium sp.]